MVGFIGYSIFAAVPFLYELRALLDWSCTATTLSLFDWLKLEDIHTSLFMVTVSRKVGWKRLRILYITSLCCPGCHSIAASRWEGWWGGGGPLPICSVAPAAADVECPHSVCTPTS